MANLGPDFLVNTTTTGNQQSPSVTALADGRFVAVWQSSDTGDSSGGCVRMRIYNPDGTPTGNDQIVNSATGNDQIRPVVAALEGGGFVIAWESVLADGGSDNGIRARVFDDAGNPLPGGDILVNTTTTGEQTDPAIVALGGGGFAIAWTSDDGSETGTALRARLFDADGTAVVNGNTSDANDFHVNQGAQNADQTAVSLAATADGGFVATWQSTDLNFDIDGAGIRALFFASNGVPVGGGGSEFQVNLDGNLGETEGNQIDPVVTALANGRFLVTWTTNDFLDDTSSSGVMGRIFNADSTPDGNAFVINSTTQDDQVRSHVAALPVGGFVAVYMSEEGIGDSDIRVRLFDDEGFPSGNDFVVNIGTGSDTGIQRDPSVTVLPDGRFVVAWWNDEPGYDGDGSSVQAIIFETDGNGILDVTVGGTDANDTLTGGDGKDTLNGGKGDDALDGLDGDDFLNGGDGDDTLNSLNGNDTLDGGLGADKLNGGNDDDLLLSSAGGDIFDGGADTDDGSDMLVYYQNALGIYLHLGLGLASGGDASFDKMSNVEMVVGTEFNDTLIGDDNDNELHALAGADTLDGGAGDDKIMGGLGADIIDGGAGDFDGVIYDFSNAGVTLTLGANGAQATASGGVGSDAIGDKVSNVEIVLGSLFADSLTGNERNNILLGGFGTDVLAGRDGNDELEGGEGNDTLDGGNGDDVLRPGNGIDTVIGGAGNDTVSYDDGFASGMGGISITLGVNGAQTIASGSTAQGDKISLIENVVGTDDDLNGDTITGNALDNIINGMSGKDVLDGGLGNNTLSYEFSNPAVTVVLNSSYEGGHAEGDIVVNFQNVIGGRDDDKITGDGGDNVIEGREGADTLSGSGNGAVGDTVSYAGADGAVTIVLNTSASGSHAAGDTISAFENLTGSKFDDTLTGDALKNVISGGDGKDILRGGAGDDTIDGGAGLEDQVQFTDAGVGVTLTLGAGGIAAFTSGTGLAADIGIDKVLNVEDIVGSGFADKFTGNALDNIIAGLAGADELDGGLNGAYGDTLNYFSDSTGIIIELGAANIDKFGTGGHAQGDKVRNFENVDGGSANDKITGNAGNNVIEGADGGDEMHGAAGIDTLSYSSAQQAVSVALSATGVIVTSDVNTDADGDTGDGFENLIGSESGDNLKSDHATVATIIDGRGGDDIIRGTDVVVLSDTLTGGDGDDTVNGGKGNDKLFGNDGVDDLEGDDGNDTIDGGAGVDELEGGVGNDIIKGGDGDDRVTGGAGADNMDGGAGLDTLGFSGAGSITINLAANTVSGTSESSGDTIKNFEHVDAFVAGSAVITGTAGYNELSGGTGDDTIEGGNAGDLLDGEGNGAGGDTLSYKNSAVGVVVDTIQEKGFAGDADGDTFNNFENFWLSAKDDFITDDINAVNSIDGGLGIDTISYRDQTPAFGIAIDLTKQYTVSATGVFTGGTQQGGAFDKLAGFENIIGTDKDDSLTGDTKNNVIEGGLGADVLDGGAHVTGGDTLSYASSGVRVRLSLGEVIANVSTVTFQTDVGSDSEGDSAKNFENVIGSAFDDSLTGNSAANILRGGAGTDTLRGNKGDDTLDGGAGSDLADFGSASTAVTVNLITGKASGGDGNDTLISIENVLGSIQADLITGDTKANQLSGSDGNDTLIGGDGDDKLFGNTGQDLLNGGAGADALDGGFSSGPDTATYVDSKFGVTVSLLVKLGSGGDAEGDTLNDIENLIGSAKDDELAGDTVANVLTGGAGNDLLIGFTNDDTLNGDAGNDTVIGGVGADLMDGGADTDTLSYVGSDFGVIVTLNLAAFGAISTGGDAQGDKNKNFENLVGTDHVDKLTGNTANNVIEGGKGGDELDGAAGTGDTLSYASSASSVTVTLNLGTFVGKSKGGDAEDDQNKNFENLIGSASNDILEGNTGANIIKGGALDDLIRGNAGIDTLLGEAGDDEIFGGAGADIMDGGAGGFDILHYDLLVENITLTLGNGGAQTTVASNTVGAQSAGDRIANFEQVVTGDGDDKVTGSSGIDFIYATDGDDIVEGGDGGDTLDGGDGLNDTLSYSTNTVGITLFLGSGFASGGHASGDTISGFENLIGTAFVDNISGDAAANKLSGGDGNDSISGDNGDDVIDGGKGDDFLGGGADKDTLTGGDGNDNLSGDDGIDTISGGNGDDIIRGGVGADILKGEAHGTGGDTLSYAGNGGSVTVTLKGTTLAAEVSGGDAAGDTATGFENLTGSNQNDTLTGDAGANVIEGGDGADILDGGAGIDTLSYATSGGIQLNLGTGFAQGDDATGDAFKNFENVRGGNDADVITGDANANKIEGGADNDILEGAGFFVGDFDLSHTKGIDTVNGGSGNDIIGGGIGNDILDGGTHGVMFGGDTISYRNFEVAVKVTLGAQGISTTATAGTESDKITNFEHAVGGFGNDVLTGNDDFNLLSGEEGDDTLTGNGGDDGLTGGADDDIYVGGEGNDKFFGATVKDPNDPFNTLDDADNSVSGFDTVIYGRETGTLGVSVNLASETGTDTFGDTDSLEDIENLFGSRFADTLIGSDLGANSPEGFGGLAGADSIDGGADLVDNHDEVRYDRDAEFGGTAGVTVNLTNSDIVNQTFNGKLISITKNSGKDGFGTIDSIINIEGIRGTAQNDFFFGTTENDQGLLKGLKGADYISGSGDDFADYSSDGEHGGAGRVLVNLSNLSLTLRATTTTTLALAAGKGFDGFNVANVFDTIVGLNNIQGTDSVNNGTHALAVNDVLVGNANVNEIRGFGGNDSLVGLAGNDILNGMDGDFDEASYIYDHSFGAVAGVTVNLSSATVSGVGTETTKDAFGNIDTLIDIEAAAGTIFGDEFYGGTGANRFYGYKGNDKIDGTADVGDIIGVTDLDIVDYSADNILTGLGAITVDLNAGTGKDGFGDTDTLIDIEIVIGGKASADNLKGGDTGNTSYEGFAGLGGADIIDGGTDGFDEAIYYYDEAFGGAFGITVNLAAIGTGTIRDGFGATDIVSNIEAVAGTSKADTFNGAVNISNTFRGFASADTFDGKDTGTAGADTLDYSTDHEFGAKHGIIVNFTGSAQLVDLKAFGGTGTLSVASNRIYDSFSGAAAVFDIVKDIGTTATIEHVNGTVFGDVMFGNARDNNFSGGGGADTLNGSDGDDGLFGGDGNDVLNGGDDIDTLFGGNGNDTLTGGQGADDLDGNGDIDTAVYGGSGNVVITLGLNGTVAGFSASGGDATGDELTNIENLTTGGGKDVLTGNNLANVLSSGSGDDILAGLAGADTLDGGTGTDMIDYSKDAGAGATHGVIVNLSSSTVTVSGPEAAGFNYNLGDIDVAANTAYDAFNDDTLIFDTLIAVEYVTGTSFKDVLIGNDGNNRLIGGFGGDTLTGGAGGDGFQYNLASDGGDTITDFDVAEDFIRIDQDNFGLTGQDAGQHPEAATGINQLQADYFVIGDTATLAGHGQFMFDDTNGDLWWDFDGTGGGIKELIANLNGTLNLTINDILLI